MIKLIENYYIDSDEKNIILKEKVTRTKKEDSTKYEADNTLGYFSSIENAILALVNIVARKSIMTGEISTLKDYVDKIKDLKEQMIEHML